MDNHPPCFFALKKNLSVFHIALPGFHHRDDHGELLRRFHGMRHVRRHVKLVSGMQLVELIPERKLTSTTQDVDNDMMGRCVLGKLLPRCKSEEHDPRCCGFKHRAANNAVRRELRFFIQGYHFPLAFFVDRFCFHVSKMAHNRRRCIDLNQKSHLYWKPRKWIGLCPTSFLNWRLK